MNTSFHHPTPSVPSTDGDLTERVRRIVGVVARRRTYLDLTYLLLGLPLGTLWFVVVVTGVAVGASLVLLALIGIPMLLALWYVVAAFANVERRAANSLLGCAIPTRPVRSPVGGNVWTRLRAFSADPHRRRELGFLLLRFPVGVATFTAGVVGITVPFVVAYSPFAARYVEDSFGNWFWSSELHEFASDSPWSWALVPVGALALIGSLHMLNALAAACGRWASSSLRAE